MRNEEFHVSHWCGFYLNRMEGESEKKFSCGVDIQLDYFMRVDMFGDENISAGRGAGRFYTDRIRNAKHFGGHGAAGIAGKTNGGTFDRR